MSENPKKTARSKRNDEYLGATPLPADTLPPHSIEAEQGVLGCVMLDATESMSECEERGVRPEWFYDLKHRAIWSALAALYDDGKAIDTITVMEWLKGAGGLEQVGGIAYLATLPDVVPSASNISHYLDIVREKWTRRRIITNAAAAVAQAHGEENIDRVIADTERAALALSEDNTGHAERHIKELVLENVDDLDNYHRGSAQVTGLTTGLSYLDKVTGGLGGENGNLILIGARPGTGKTSLGNDLMLWAALSHVWFTPFKIADYCAKYGAERLTDAEFVQAVQEGNILLDAAYSLARDGSVLFRRHTGIPCVFFSLEMTAKRLVRRMLFQHSGSDLQRWRTGFANADDFKKLGATASVLAGAEIYIDDTSRLTMDMFKARCRRLVRQYGIKLIVVDYVQIIMPERARGQRPDRVTEMEEISSQLRALGKELNVPLVVLAQLNRDVAKAEKWRKPQMTDLANCDALARDADVIVLLYEDKLKEEQAELWDAQLQEMARRAGAQDARDWSRKFRRINALVDKNRDGTTGDCELVFECSSTHFHDYGDWQKKHGLKDLAAGEARSKGPERELPDTGGDWPEGRA